MAFPNKKELAKIRKKLTTIEGTRMLSPRATPLEKFRWDLCQQMVRYKLENDLTLEALGKELGIDKGKVSKILRHRIDEFSTDRLIGYLQILYPETKLKVG